MWRRSSDLVLYFQDEEVGVRMSKISASMRPLQYSFDLKWKLSKNLKLSVLNLVFDHGHAWVLGNDQKNTIASASTPNDIFAKNKRSYVLFDKVRSSEIRKSLNIEPLFLRIKISQLRWFRHVSRMPRKRLPKQALLAKNKR